MEATYRKNVAGRRQACKDLAALHMAGKLQEVRDWVEANGAAMGRSQHWKDACRFLVEKFDGAEALADDGDTRRVQDWAILQGITYMNMHAS